MKHALAGLFAVAAITGAATGAQAQSFNCHKAYFLDEKLICENPELSTLDERLNAIYGQNMRHLSEAERRALDRQEEQWVIARRRCGGRYRCVEGFYHSRIDELVGRLGDAYGPPSAAARGESPGGRAAAIPPVSEPPNARMRRASTRAEERRERESTGSAIPPESAGPPAIQPPREAFGAPRSPAAADKARQSSPSQEAVVAPRRATAAVTEQRSTVPQRRPVETPTPTTGGGIGPPRIEFADPGPSR
jgi:uncharacterized protein